MRRISNFSPQKLFQNLQIDREIQQEFLRECVRKNDFSLRIVCFIIFAAECVNLIRVVFLSRSGLETRNNRIYFSMYCALIALAALWMVLRKMLRSTDVKRQWAVQYAMTCLILLWHLCLNTYDLYRDPAAGSTVLVTALLALALLIQSPPWYSLAQFAAAYLIFRAMMAPLLDTGDRLNLTITFLVALAISLINTHHRSVALKQQKQILQMNAKLQELVQSDPLTGLLNKVAVEYRAEQLLHDLQYTEKRDGLTLFLLDLDEFKLINDRYGHPCGDHVLVETAESLRRAFPDAVGLGRIGGDEFAILYDRAMSEGEAADLGRELAQQLENIQCQNWRIEVRCSMGICICTLAQCSYQRLYAETDQMLYRAKKTGRGRCCVLRLESLEHIDPERVEV